MTVSVGWSMPLKLMTGFRNKMLLKIQGAFVSVMSQSVDMLEHCSLFDTAAFRFAYTILRCRKMPQKSPKNNDVITAENFDHVGLWAHQSRSTFANNFVCELLFSSWSERSKKQFGFDRIVFDNKPKDSNWPLLSKKRSHLFAHLLISSHVSFLSSHVLYLDRGVKRASGTSAALRPFSQM